MSRIPTNTYPIGTKFTPMSKHPKEHTVVDYHTTTNMAGDVIKFMYIATHDFLGQSIKSEHVHVTLQRGL